MKFVILLAFAALLVSPVGISAQKKNTPDIQVQKCWEYKYAGTAEKRLSADSSTVYFVRDTAVVEAVSLETGKRAWISDVGGFIVSDIIAVNGNIVLVRRSTANGETASSIVALSGTTGITKWSTPIEGVDGVQIRQVADSVVAVSSNGAVTLMNAADGTIRSTKRIASFVGHEPLLTDTDVYFASENIGVSSLGIAEGEPTAIAKVPFAITVLDQTEKGTLLWGDERGFVTSFSITAGKPNWQFKSGAAVGMIIGADGLILAASNDNFVYALSPGNGDRVWKKRISGRIQVLVAISDELVLASSFGERNLQLLNTENGRTAAQIVLDGDELPISAVGVNANSAVLLGDAALYLFSTATCQKK